MLQLLTRAVAALPRRWVLGLGRALGLLLFSVLRVRRRVTLDNLRRGLALDHRAAARLGRRVYDHLCTGALEFLQVGRLTPARARALLGDEALARIATLRERGKGLLVLTAHLGNWDLLACAGGRCGLPLHVVTREIRSTWLNRFWMAERRACGVSLLPARGSAAAVVAALRRNELVALVLDQHEPGGAVVPFCGRPAATSTTLARLAVATGAPVLPVFLLRNGPGWRVKLGEVVEGSALAHLGGPQRIHSAGGGGPQGRPELEQRGHGEGGERRDELALPQAGRGALLLELTASFTRIIEEQIRDAPEQWLWLHRRWKV